MTSFQAPTPDRSRLLALGWAAFVACSWTWCIGIYLPVLMVRDYGPAGWMVFALPNIIGTAALGWVLQRPGSAARLARSHWPMALAFSAVTVLFHAFFVGWIIRRLVGDTAWLVVVPLTAGLYFVGRVGRRDLVAAVALFAASLATFIIAACQPEPISLGISLPRPPMDLLWLAPVSVFGFVLCPYLDLTFLRARASTAPLAGIGAFTLGFGVLFLILILFTLWYARYVEPAAIDHLPRTLAWLIGAHMMLQLSFTVALHLRTLSEDPRFRRVQYVAPFAVAIVLVSLLGVWPIARLPVRYSSGEFVYRLFMAFYGLIFPTYVWHFMTPFNASRANKWIVYAAVIVLAIPFFWAGFIAGRMVWLTGGLAIVLLPPIVHRLSKGKRAAL